MSNRHSPARLLVVILASLLVPAPGRAADPPVLKWGGDRAGGIPYIFEDKQGRLVGFETELADYLAAELGRRLEFVQDKWEDLPEALGRGDIDVVLNGYEYDPDLNPKYPATLPYYVYTLRLAARRGDDSIRSWDDLKARGDQPGKRVVVLRSSAAQRFLEKRFGNSVRLEPADFVSEAFDLLEAGRTDATMQDSPAARYFANQRPEKLHLVDRPLGANYYVILTRPGDKDLRDRLNEALRRGMESGKLKEIYKKYGLWNGEQERLSYAYSHPWPPEDADQPADGDEEGGGPAEGEPSLSLWSLSGKIAKAAGLTVALACCAMPLAIVVGMAVAVGRLYGPGPLRGLLTAYVEVLRGTPVLLQLFVLFFLLPQVAAWTGWGPLIWLTTLPPFVVGVAGLAINYSAYEAENYRAGLLAVPKGQMEAALALGMRPSTALRRVILPQAIRIVIPPVVNDFIALFKDTSVCSMIMITELTGLYYQYRYDRNLVLELALTVAVLYFLMSYTLALLARRLEGRR